MTKRDLFAELTEGFDALAEARTGKRTLRTHEVELKPEARSHNHSPGTEIDSGEAESFTACVRQLPQNKNQNTGKLGTR